MQHQRTVRILALSLLTLATLALGACASLQETIAQAQAIRAQAAEARAHVAEQLAALEAAHGTLPPDAPQTPDLEAAASAARAQLAVLDAAIVHADRVIAEMTAPTDPITQGVGSIATLLPPGTRGPAVLGAALIATLLRARQVRQGAGSIAASIQKAMQDPAFKAAFQAQSATIRSIQTPAAQRIVDQETRQNTPFRSPI